MSESRVPVSSHLTAGHYGFGARRIHRDDFARIVTGLLPGITVELIPQKHVLTEPEAQAAARVCGRLAARHPGEPLGRLAEQVAYRLAHPATRGAPRELLLYAVALLCREEEAAAAVDMDVSIEAVLENRAARTVADTLEPLVDTTTRYTVQTAFDGDFVRAARRMTVV